MNDDKIITMREKINGVFDCVAGPPYKLRSHLISSVNRRLELYIDLINSDLRGDLSNLSIAQHFLEILDHILSKEEKEHVSCINFYETFNSRFGKPSFSFIYFNGDYEFQM